MLSGAAYVYKQNGEVWTKHQKLVSSDRIPEEQFGQWMEISGDVLLVGTGRNSAGA